MAVLVLDGIDEILLQHVLVEAGCDVCHSGGERGVVDVEPLAGRVERLFCGAQPLAVSGAIKSTGFAGGLNRRQREAAELIGERVVGLKQSLLHQDCRLLYAPGVSRRTCGEHEAAQVLQPQADALIAADAGESAGHARFPLLAAFAPGGGRCGRDFPGFPAEACFADIGGFTRFASALAAAGGEPDRGGRAGRAPNRIFPINHPSLPGSAGTLDEMRLIRNIRTMSSILRNVLEREDVERVCAELAEAAWTTGKATAGAMARSVKENQQANAAQPRVQALERFVDEALRRHPLFEIAARPSRLSRILFSRYREGMGYGAHNDDALTGQGAHRLRTDLSFTLFLAAPASYDGGELVIESALGEREVKLDAGDAVLYATSATHRVATVTRGERLAAVGWVQSYVADAGERDILFDLSLTRLQLAQAGAAPEYLLALDRAISNLLRRWAR